MSEISVIGSGRWGTFLAWYAANCCGMERVKMYSRPTSPDFIELKETRKNAYLSLSDNMFLYEKFRKSWITILSLSLLAANICVRWQKS